MVLLDNYFNLNKEQRLKFLSKEERSELRKEKRRRAEQAQKEEEIEQEEEQQEDSEELRLKRKAEKKAAKKAKKAAAKKEEESEEEEEEKPVKKAKKSKKSKKQESDSEEEEVKEKISKKVKKSAKKEESSSEEEQQQIGDDVDAPKWRKEKELTLSGEGWEDKKFHPFTTFKNTGMPDSIVDFTKQFKEPSLIQAQSWPILLQGRDCIAIAETGSGKTLGFLLPAFNHILKTTNDIQPAVNPRVIILSPTRELATQIHEVCTEAQQKCGIKSVCAYGGVSKHDQKQMLRQGVQVVIGTPGRMKDLMSEGAIKTQDISMVILDEADRMLDMGFKPDISYIFSQVKGKRQSVMFSATWPKEVQEVANEFISKPVMIKIGTDEGTANKRVTQTVEVIKGYARNNRLEQLLKDYNKNNAKIIVFVLYKAEASRMEQFIQQKGHKVVALHGDMSQKARNLSFQQFKDCEANILVATDVAARGLDIPNVEHVINFSFPLTVSDYVHRIGRTGRAGKFGNSYTFFQPDFDKKLAGDLCQIMKEAGQPVPKDLEAFGPTIHKQAQHAMYGAHFKANADPNKKATKIKL